MINKKLFFIAFLLQWLYAPSQVQKIVKILNRELQKEVKAQQKDSSNYYGERFEVIKQYSIKDTNDQNINILALEIKKKDTYSNTHYTIQQEIDLSKIKAIVKDINIIFRTDSDASKVTEVDENGKESISTGDMYFLNLSYEKKNEKLAYELIQAFKKAGYSIKKEYWYD
ncbi:hypothetical protein [Chryseobacterium taiwanense]|uniref:Uncharacterized protein n=1 Tax=Chryseobacterium taiwanense TaxID=363331 RepID=A0A0B4DF69_9FLAO|nr:hypothetical protein [Chryseobacterium taiwanense]KIC63030.1 hypothetical protein RM51_10305 [Chryseobacterium taiwanense]